MLNSAKSIRISKSGGSLRSRRRNARNAPDGQANRRGELGDAQSRDILGIEQGLDACLAH